MDETPAAEDSGPGVEVVLTGTGKTAPCCPHGPTLLFQKICKGAGNGRRFYACSACRDRKDCSFFQWEDEEVSEARLAAREAEKVLKRAAFSPEQLHQRLQQFLLLLPEQRLFCQDCQVLVLPAELGDHAPHVHTCVGAAQLRRPSRLLRPLDNKKSNAQYLFAERTCQFLLAALERLGYNKVLCVGTPRLHEMIKLRNLEAEHQPMSSLLMDIDFRYAQFYGPDEFCHYNMFNHHCFQGEASLSVLRSFLRQVEKERVVLVADPPFGGLVTPLAHSLSIISQMWQEEQQQDAGDGVVAEMPLIWIFPYFFEPRILACLPSLVMLDYQVDYDNHPLYKHGKMGRKQSPVRLFTNIPAKDFVLPEDEGYRFCPICKRYVSALNKHCSKCNTCPSKDGREWKHCSTCQKCVKPSWRHCKSCGRCSLPDHPCNLDPNLQGCFSCGSLQHKRRACPLTRTRRPPGPSHYPPVKAKVKKKNKKKKAGAPIIA